MHLGSSPKMQGQPSCLEACLQAAVELPPSTCLRAAHELAPGCRGAKPLHSAPARCAMRQTAAPAARSTPPTGGYAGAGPAAAHTLRSSSELPSSGQGGARPPGYTLGASSPAPPAAAAAAVSSTAAKARPSGAARLDNAGARAVALPVYRYTGTRAAPGHAAAWQNSFHARPRSPSSCRVASDTCARAGRQGERTADVSRLLALCLPHLLSCSVQKHVPDLSIIYPTGMPRCSPGSRPAAHSGRPPV